MKTKKLIYLAVPNNPEMTYQIQNYVFRFDKALKPIPVEVDSKLAEILLQMTGRTHGCCPKKPVLKLFKEVK